MKINKNKYFKYHIYKYKQGFALLFSIVVSSILLSVALGVSNIAIKEAFFSTSAKDANDAFYAADSAIECTLFYDNSSLVTNAFIGTTPITPTLCDNKQFTIVKKVTADPGYDLTFTSTLSQLGPSGKGCSMITVNKMADKSKTKVTSVGYNNGGTVLGACSQTNNSIQRVIELNY